MIAELRSYLVGLEGYFRLAETPGVFRELDEWIRHRLRLVQLKQWKRGSTIYRELRARGISRTRRRSVAAQRRDAGGRTRACCSTSPCPRATSTSWESRGLPRDLNSRTAGCGPARPVVWEGSSRDLRLPPIPIVRAGPSVPRRAGPLAPCRYRVSTGALNFRAMGRKAPTCAPGVELASANRAALYRGSCGPHAARCPRRRNHSICQALAIRSRKIPHRHRARNLRLRRNAWGSGRSCDRGGALLTGACAGRLNARA